MDGIKQWWGVVQVKDGQYREVMVEDGVAYVYGPAGHDVHEELPYSEFTAQYSQWGDVWNPKSSAGLFAELRELRDEESRLRAALSEQSAMWHEKVAGLQARLDAMVRISASPHAHRGSCCGCDHQFWYFSERMPAACPACNRDPRVER